MGLVVRAESESCRFDYLTTHITFYFQNRCSGKQLCAVKICKCNGTILECEVFEMRLSVKFVEHWFLSAFTLDRRRSIWELQARMLIRFFSIQVFELARSSNVGWRLFSLLYHILLRLPGFQMHG